MILMSSLHIRIFLVVVGLGVTIHLMTLKTLRREEISTKSSTNDQPVAGESEASNTITAEEAKARLDSESGIILVDVRTLDEYNEGHIPNAILLPVDSIADEAETIIPNKDATYFVYCRSGNRSATASAQLAQMGYKNIYELGGINYWPYDQTSGE